MPEINLWGFIPQKFLSSAQLIWAHPIHCCWTVMFSKGDNTPIRFRYISILMFSQGDRMPNVITKVLVLFLHLSFYEVKCQQIHFSSIFLLHCWLDELTILCRYICTISWVHLAKNGAEKYMWTDGSEFKLLNSVSNELNIELDTAVWEWDVLQMELFCWGKQSVQRPFLLSHLFSFSAICCEPQIPPILLSHQHWNSHRDEYRWTEYDVWHMEVFSHQRKLDVHFCSRTLTSIVPRRMMKLSAGKFNFALFLHWLQPNNMR